MSATAALWLSSIAFVGTHFLMSHPLRKPMVDRMGTKAFRGVYSLVSFVTLGAMIYAYRAIGREEALWQAGDWAMVVAELLMWFASILLIGSFFGNPAMVGAKRPNAPPDGVLGITRHPMMWSFAIWALVHAWLIATPKALILDAAILVLALGGPAGQDRKKARLMGKSWHDWSAQTAFVPFTRGLRSPGLVALVGGTFLFLP